MHTSNHRTIVVRGPFSAISNEDSCKISKILFGLSFCPICYDFSFRKSKMEGVFFSFFFSIKNLRQNV